jgi:hypothetical protein
MRSRNTLRRAFLGSVAAAGLTLAASASAVSVPQSLTHQGRLYDASNQPVSATLSVVFSIYADGTATTPLWTETDQITFEEGYFSVSLGGATPFTANLFDGSVRYLGITVGAEPEMTPRVSVQSVPYAMVAGDAIGNIHPTSVSINGTTVINAQGNWTGPSTGLAGPTAPASRPRTRASRP